MSGTLLPLFKVTLKQTFDFRGKNKRNVSFWGPVLLILLFGSLLSAFYAYTFSEIIKLAELDYRLILYSMAGFASLLCITTTITKVKSTLFAGQDYDLLASLPIQKRNIIFVKFASLYLVEFLYSFILVVPPTIVILFFGCTPLCLIEAIILLFTVPMLPLFVAGMIGIAIGFVSDRYRFGNALTIILYLGLMGTIFYMSMMMNNNSSSQADIANMFDVFMWYNPALYLFTTLPNGLNYLAFIGVNLLSLVFMIFIMAFCYDYFHFLLTTTKSHRKYIEKEQKQKGQFKALFVLDLKRYFTSKSYLMNTITGGVLTVIMIIMLLVSFNSAGGDGQSIIKDISPYMVLFIMWCVGISVPSAVAINFEGKYFWQIKSLPISYKDYSYSKILLSEVVLAPFVLIASIILMVFSELTAINIITIIVLPQIYLLGMSFIAFYINTYFYKLNWTNEMEAVKNSKGMVVAMLLDFVYSILIIAAMLGFGLPFGFIYGSIAAFILVISATIFFVLKVKKNCTNQISKIEI